MDVGKMRGGLVVSSAQTQVQTTRSRIARASPAPRVNPSSLNSPSRASLRPAGLPLGRASSWSASSPPRPPLEVVCGGLGDFIGGDLLGFDLDKWVEDVEKYGSIAVYAPAEGGYESRYCTRLKAEGYHFMNISARGLGDPEAYLTKVHGVRPPHLGKQAVVRWYYPPEVDYRLSSAQKFEGPHSLGFGSKGAIEVGVAVPRTTPSHSSQREGHCRMRDLAIIQMEATEGRGRYPSYSGSD